MSKYTRAEESLVRALILEHSTNRTLLQLQSPARPKGCLFNWVILIPLVALMIPLTALMVPLIDEVPELQRAPLVEHVVILALIGLALYFVSPLVSLLQSRRNGRQWAKDKVDSLMTMAALPWKIERTVLMDKTVQYRLIVPVDSQLTFSGNPTICMGAHAAEKADLLILTVREDHRLVDKWTNAVVPPR